jgi:hypothetical protein
MYPMHTHSHHRETPISPPLQSRTPPKPPQGLLCPPHPPTVPLAAARALLTSVNLQIRFFDTSSKRSSHHLPSPQGCHPVSLCQYVGTLGAPQTRQKADLHEACHFRGPLAGLAAGRGARGDAVMSAPRMHMSELRGHHTVPVLVVVASKLLTIFPRKIT